jgi:AraC-like DNA-binding protein
LWANEFPTSTDEYAPEVLEAVGHIAVPIGQNLGTIEDEPVITRRFIHRSIQEHLVAQYVALQMTAEQASKELLSHIWYDPDWIQAAPAALAMHPKRSQVLRELLLRVYGRPHALLDEPLCDHLADRLGPAFGKTTSCPEAYQRWRDALGQLAIDVTPEPDYDDRIAAVLNHLRATPSPPPSIEDLMRIAHLSESRLQHLFRDQVGVPIRRYLLWHRYLTAMSLLADGTSVTRRARSRLRRQCAPDTDRYPDERLHADEDAVPYVADELSLTTPPRFQQRRLARKPLTRYLFGSAARLGRVRLVRDAGSRSGRCVSWASRLTHAEAWTGRHTRDPLSGAGGRTA